MGAFAAIASLLAAIGLFGVISYLVSERRRELAVRMALLAKRGNIAWMILREGAVLTLTGCTVGLAAFAIGSKLLQSSLYQVSVFDPLTMALAPSALTLVALLACHCPARRAMLLDPMVVSGTSDAAGVGDIEWVGSVSVHVYCPHRESRDHFAS